MTEEKYKFNMKYLLGVSLVSALGGLLFGYDLVVIGGAKEFYELVYGLSTPKIQGWAVSSCIIGCIIGAMGVGKPADMFGRKKMLSISAVLFFVSAIGSGYAPTFTQFVIYRLLGGIGMGMASTVSPMYIAEISPEKIRGRLVSIQQLNIVIGILLAQFVNFTILQSHPIPEDIKNDRPVVTLIDQKITDLEKANKSEENIKPVTMLSTEDMFSDKQMELIKSGVFLASIPSEVGDNAAINAELQKEQAEISVLNIKSLREHYDERLMDTWNGRTGWRWMFAAESVWAFLFFAFLFLVPNSPRWLCRVEKFDKARGVLGKIGGGDYAGVCLVDIKETLKGSHHINELAELSKPKMTKILAIGVVVMVFSQWCGINVIFNYAHDIFKAAGSDVEGVLFNLLIVGITNFLFTIVAMATIDKLGRKLLILFGSITLGLSFTALGFCFYAGYLGVPVLALVLLCIAFFAASIGPVSWVFVSEMFPNSIRGLATSIAVLSLWVANFVLTYTFPTLFTHFGFAKTFWLYAGICIAGALFIYFFVPETKGKTLEQIEREFVD